MEKNTIFCAAAVVAIMNIAAFALMGYDKRCARLNAQRDYKSGRRRRQEKRRVPESTLFWVTACFGGLGGVLGMKVFHHKTQHWYFKVFFPALLIVQIALLALGGYVLTR